MWIALGLVAALTLTIFVLRVMDLEMAAADRSDEPMEKYP